MWITSLAVRRPVAVAALFLAVVLAGYAAYRSLPINQFPNVNIPVVSVVTTYPGAGPEEVELQVTRLIEDAVAGLNDVDTLTSVSSEGSSQVTVTFTERANNDLIGTAVERQVNAVVQRLPAEADRPSVVKVDFAQIPVMQLALVGDRLAPEELYRVADEQLRPGLESLSGVSQVSIVGGRQQEVRVEVDPAKLTAFGVSLGQIQSALAQANQTVPSGSISEQGREYSLRLYSLVASPEELGRVTVGGPRGAPVRLQDVATVRLGARDQRQVSRYNRQQAIVIGLTKQNGANTTDVDDAVQSALPRLRAALPGGSSLVVVQNTTPEIRGSLLGVQQELLTAIVLTSVVLLLFLHRFVVSGIVLLSIPTTLLATLVAMQLMGFSFNFLSTLGLTLTIGILVDDSIVVLENILRKLEVGEPPTAAAINGRAEIGLAAVAITLVDVVVFAPVGLVTGQIGAFFREFGFTIAAATLVSLLVSFTLTPLLAARLLRNEGHESGGSLGRLGRAWDRGFLRLERAYRRVLTWALGHRLPVVLAATASLVAGILLLTTGRVANEFFPAIDQGVLSIRTEMAPGTALARHDAAMRQIEEIVFQVPEVVSVTSSVGAGGGGFGSSAGQARFGSLTIQLQPKQERARDAFQVGEDLRQRLASVQGVTARVGTPDGGGGGGAQAVGVRVQGPDSGRLAEIAGQIEGKLAAMPELRDVTNSAAAGLPELRILVDRNRADDLGLSAGALGQVLRSSYAGAVATKYRRPDGRSIDVRVFLGDQARADVGALAELPLLTATGGTIRLGQVATIQEVTGPAQIDRRGRERVVTVGASVAEGAVLGTVVPKVQAAIKELVVPPGYRVDFGGTAEGQNRAFGQLFAALGASILLAYLLMAILYDSFVHPLVILFSLPVAVGGAIGGLFVFGYNFSLFAMIGLILLVGLAIKNGILLIDRTNHNRARGLSPREALLEAGPTRLRPILMTSATISIALLPTALQFGEGSAFRAPLAAVVLGGVISSTILTLVIVPVVYTLLEALRDGVGRLGRRHPGMRAPIEVAPAASAHPAAPLVPADPSPVAAGRVSDR